MQALEGQALTGGHSSLTESKSAIRHVLGQKVYRTLFPCCVPVWENQDTIEFHYI